MTNLEYANALRRIAGVYANNPGIVLPYDGPIVYIYNKQAFTATVAAFGAGTEECTDGTLRFQPELAEPIDFEIVGFLSEGEKS